jgi:hypothetical protein
MRRGNPSDVVDCSRPATFIFWFVVGALFAVAVMAGQGLDNWASLLRVGSDNPARAQIERELGRVHSPDRTGHDGQLYYLIARDPFARNSTVAALAAFDTNPPRYRYRRILFPLLAGGAGYFDGRTTFAGMILWIAIGFGLATVAVADLSFQLRLPGGAAFLAATNAGALISAMIMTADVLGLGLALAGLALAHRNRLGPAAVVFSLAALTKEVFLLVAFSVAVSYWWHGRRARAIAIAATPALTLTMWTAWVWTSVPGVQHSTPLLGVPFVGMWNSVVDWKRLHQDNPVQIVMAFYAAVTFTTASLMVFVGRDSMLRLVIAPWIALALCSTGIAVWDIPTNVARAFAVLWPVGMLLLVERVKFRGGSVPGAPRNGDLDRTADPTAMDKSATGGAPRQESSRRPEKRHSTHPG